MLSGILNSDKAIRMNIAIIKTLDNDPSNPYYPCIYYSLCRSVPVSVLPKSFFV